MKKSANIEILNNDLCAFETDWFRLDVLSDRLGIGSKATSAAETLRDPLVGALNILHHTPVTRLGINTSAHYRFASEEAWHAFGHLLAPKEPLSAPVLESPGTLSLTIEGQRPDEYNGHIRALALVTPFERGSTPLPRPTDRARIRALTDYGYLTSDKWDRAERRDRTTEKTIKEATRSFKPHTLRMGHVQARSSGEEWTVRRHIAADPALASRRGRMSPNCATSELLSGSSPWNVIASVTPSITASVGRVSPSSWRRSSRSIPVLSGRSGRT
jgi:hypothetical protein